MPRFIPKGLETVDAEQWLPEDSLKVFSFLKWLLDREGSGTLEAYEGQVILNVRGVTGRPDHLEEGDWCVYDLRQPVGKRFKVVDKYSFDDAYEEVPDA